jgi:hypothetical protein
LVGDNNEFSGIPTRISHISWDGDVLNQINEFDIEDPVSIQMIDDWALIASGYGNQLYQYQVSRQTLTPVMDIPLPSLVLRQGNSFYAIGNTQIQRLLYSSSGFTEDVEVLSLEGIAGIIGSAGVFGLY